MGNPPPPPPPQHQSAVSRVNALAAKSDPITDSQIRAKAQDVLGKARDKWAMGVVANSMKPLRKEDVLNGPSPVDNIPQAFEWFARLNNFSSALLLEQSANGICKDYGGKSVLQLEGLASWDGGAKDSFEDNFREPFQRAIEGQAALAGILATAAAAYCDVLLAARRDAITIADATLAALDGGGGENHALALAAVAVTAVVTFVAPPAGVSLGLAIASPILSAGGTLVSAVKDPTVTGGSPKQIVDAMFARIREIQQDVKGKEEQIAQALGAASLEARTILNTRAVKAADDTSRVRGRSELFPDGGSPTDGPVSNEHANVDYDLTDPAKFHPK